MKLSVLKESKDLETRVSATPESVKLFKRLGFEIFVDKEAGINSAYFDKDYINSGANIVERSECLDSKDICLVVRLPSVDDISKLSNKTILIGILDPYKNKDYYKMNKIEKRILNSI